MQSRKAAIVTFGAERKGDCFRHSHRAQCYANAIEISPALHRTALHRMNRRGRFDGLVAAQARSFLDEVDLSQEVVAV
jgi:hypothetical protein